MSNAFFIRLYDHFDVRTRTCGSSCWVNCAVFLLTDCPHSSHHYMHPLYGTTVNRRRRLSATPRRALSLRAPERRGEARLLEKSLATFHLSTAAPWLREKQLAQIHLAIRTYEGTECRMTLADPRIRLPHAGFVWAPDTAFHVWCARKVCLGAQKKRSYPKEKRLDNTGCRTQHSV